jgi:hypothetical protein
MAIICISDLRIMKAVESDRPELDLVKCGSQVVADGSPSAPLPERISVRHSRGPAVHLFPEIFMSKPDLATLGHPQKSAFCPVPTISNKYAQIWQLLAPEKLNSLLHDRIHNWVTGRKDA